MGRESVTLDAPFITRVSVEQIDGQHWRLLKPLRYCPAQHDDVFDDITVPAGFVTDFASTPRIVWAFMPKSGEWDSAAALHDYVYECGGRIRISQNASGTWNYRVYSKAQADNIFYDA